MLVPKPLAGRKILFSLLAILFGLAEHDILTVKRSTCTELSELILVSLPVPTRSNSELSLLLKMNPSELSGTCQFKL